MIPGHIGRETVLTYKKPNKNITTPAKALENTIKRVALQVEELVDNSESDVIEEPKVEVDEIGRLELRSIVEEITQSLEDIKKVSDDCSIDAGIVSGVFYESLDGAEVENATTNDEGNYIQDKKEEELRVKGKRKFKN